MNAEHANADEFRPGDRNDMIWLVKAAANYIVHPTLTPWPAATCSPAP